jgi:biotin carboxyl carrier protein
VETSESGRTLVLAPDDPHRRGPAAGTTLLVLIPVDTPRERQFVMAYLARPSQGVSAAAVAERLEAMSGLLAAQDLQLRVTALRQINERLRTAMQVLDATNAHSRFAAVAMALCNEVASCWNAERVTLGLLDGRYVRTTAISHVDRFDRRMELVQDLEAAMEECLDQDTEIIHPRPDAAIYVTRATERLSLRHGPVSVASLPLRHDGAPVGVMTVERRLDQPCTPDDLEVLRLICELLGPRLLELRRHDRWLGARMRDAAAELIAGVIGPRHTWTKVLAIAIIGFLVAVFTVRGPDRIESSFQVTAAVHRVVPAPFDGRIERVDVEPGDAVRGGETVLAALETSELHMELASLLAEQARHAKEADLATRDGRAVEAQIADASRRRVEAEIRLLEHRIAQADVTAPIDGTVVSGDLRRRVGSPVAKGDVLFEVARLDDLRAELEVPEHRIADLADLANAERAPARGRLASVAHPGDSIEFEVEQVSPVAEVIDQRNVFRVRVRLLQQRPWLRPGMKGVAKIEIGRRSYASLWTRPLVAWLRMKLWI